MRQGVWTCVAVVVLLVATLASLPTAAAQSDISPWRHRDGTDGNIWAVDHVTTANPTLAWVREYPDLDPDREAAFHLLLADGGLLVVTERSTEEYSVTYQLSVINAADGSVRWEAPHDSWCSPSVDASGRIWVVEQSREEPLRVYARDPGTGAVIAGTEFTDPGDNGDLCAGILRTFGDSLVYMSHRTALRALDIGQSPPRLLWTHTLDDPTGDGVLMRLDDIGIDSGLAGKNLATAVDAHRGHLLVAIYTHRIDGSDRHATHHFRYDLRTGAVVSSTPYSSYTAPDDGTYGHIGGLLLNADGVGLISDLAGTIWFTVGDAGVDVQPAEPDGPSFLYNHDLALHPPAAITRISDGAILGYADLTNLNSAFADADNNLHYSANALTSLGGRLLSASDGAAVGVSQASDGRLRWTVDIPVDDIPDADRCSLPHGEISDLGPSHPNGSLYAVGYCDRATHFTLLVARLRDNPDVRVERLSGGTRFDTAAAIATRQFPVHAPVVYLARADAFPDALAGGTLQDGPILLVPSCGAVPAAVSSTISQLRPDAVVALGGTAAVCDQVLADAAAGLPTGRLAGPTRYDTAAAISARQYPSGAAVAYLARADAFPDALAGGALQDGPILLVPACGDVPAVVLAEIARLQVDSVVALGGTAAVCDHTLQHAATGRSADRVAGPTRYDTAAAIAERQYPDGAEVAYITRADNFPDALAGGVLSGGPLLLVPSCGAVPDVVEVAASRLAPRQLLALGGPAAVCQAVLDEVAAAIPG